MTLVAARLADRLRTALDEGATRQPVLFGGDMDASDLIDPGLWAAAAVLVPIVDRPEPGVLLTVRNANLRKHAGQVAFPGGRIDPGDDSPIAAALREADEEIGLPRHHVEVVGTADRYRTVTGFEITPVLGVLPPDLPLVPQADEVADIFEVPLAFLLDPANHARKAIDWEGRERHYFEIQWQDRRIWGATAAMIVNLGRRLACIA